MQRPVRGVGRRLSCVQRSAFATLVVATFLIPVGCRSSKRESGKPAASSSAIAPPPAPPAARTIPAPSDVAAPPADAEKLPSGVVTRVIKVGKGKDRPGDNDCMKVTFAAWKRDGALFSTSRFRDEPDMQCMRRTIPGIAEALKLMVAGEERRVWVPKHLAFQAGDDDDDPKPPDVELTFDVELIEVIKAPPTPTDLKEPPKTAKKTKSGLVYQVLKKSDSKQRPQADRRVKLRYTGWYPNGTLFESTELSGRPAEFSFGDMLPGWREGLKLMVVGEKTRFWVPAKLAYGEKPRRRGTPSGDLIYDIELLEIL